MDIVAAKVMKCLCRSTPDVEYGAVLGEKLFGIYRASLYCQGVYSNDIDGCVYREDMTDALRLKPHKMQVLMPCGNDWWGSKEQHTFLRVFGSLLDFKSHPFALVVLCPGPWNTKDMLRLFDSKHDEMAFIAECIRIGCKWCKKWRKSLPDISAKVSARIASNSIGVFTTTGSIKKKLAGALDVMKPSRQSRTAPLPAAADPRMPSQASSG